MKVFGYIRVSTEQQDIEKQRHLLLEYAHNNKLTINEFITVEMSSRNSHKLRRIDELMEKLRNEDLLIVAELSRLGRNMLEVLNLINQLSRLGVKIIFIRQPEISTAGPHGKLLLAIYSYFAEAEREFISVRTKQGLAAVKARGIVLGRRKGSKSKDNVLMPFKEQIKNYLSLKLSIGAIRKLINPLLPRPVTYNSYKYFIKNDVELLKLGGQIL